jgi:hypothetical protein
MPSVTANIAQFSVRCVRSKISNSMFVPDPPGCKAVMYRGDLNGRDSDKSIF